VNRVGAQVGNLNRGQGAPAGREPQGRTQLFPAGLGVDIVFGERGEEVVGLFFLEQG